ncbi:aminotransferase class IV [Trichocoleus sp. DQ-A3]|uniref:aminotransferase class IV n=1 Tax=Cyanophyceae TaxID=3028117 RepID=UPI001689D5EB|nr:aminotransferase class IV [Coleofasciculus sp. FACHB-125]MBD1900407.1 aminotransferase class IV [Coleofasciculus sp. FACHB-125]
MYWYNGNLIESGTLELAIDDPGLLYGAKVFTTLRVYEQSLESPLTNWKGHCDRLCCSLQTFDWQQPDWEQLRQQAEALIPHFPVLRITLFPDGREWISGRFFPDDLTERQKYGVKSWLAAEPLFCRSIPEHKTGNYLPAWLALGKAQQMGATEAILVDDKGNWLETSTGNLWGWRDGKWWTPPLDAGILPGIARSQLINWLASQNLTPGQVPWDADFVKGLSVLAYSNCVVQVVPIHTVLCQEGTLTFDPLHSSLEQLQSLFQRYHTHQASP